MSEFCIYMKMPPYLRQWFIHLHGGEEPVKLAKGSVESNILRMGLRKLPNGMLPAKKHDDEVSIVIPYYKQGPDPRYYNYMSEKGFQLLEGAIKVNFRIQLHKDLGCFFDYHIQLQDLIYTWMENNGIESTETNWLAVSKIYQRMRESYKKGKRREAKKLQRK